MSPFDSSLASFSSKRKKADLPNGTVSSFLLKPSLLMTISNTRLAKMFK